MIPSAIRFYNTLGYGTSLSFGECEYIHQKLIHPLRKLGDLYTLEEGPPSGKGGELVRLTASYTTNLSNKEKRQLALYLRDHPRVSPNDLKNRGEQLFGQYSTHLYDEYDPEEDQDQNSDDLLTETDSNLNENRLSELLEGITNSDDFESIEEWTVPESLQSDGSAIFRNTKSGIKRHIIIDTRQQSYDILVRYMDESGEDKQVQFNIDEYESEQRIQAAVVNQVLNYMELKKITAEDNIKSDEYDTVPETTIESRKTEADGGLTEDIEQLNRSERTNSIEFVTDKEASELVVHTIITVIAGTILIIFGLEPIVAVIVGAIIAFLVSN